MLERGRVVALAYYNRVCPAGQSRERFPEFPRDSFVVSLENEDRRDEHDDWQKRAAVATLEHLSRLHPGLSDQFAKVLGVKRSRFVSRG